MNNFARDYVLRLFTSSDSNSTVLVPGFDNALSCGEIMDFGRILKCHLDWDPLSACEAADDFSEFAESLFEIGDWYSNSEEPYGSEPDEEFMALADTMDIWRNYIADFDFSSDIEERKNLCELNNITGFAPEILLFMANRYCKYSAIAAPSVILESAVKDLAAAFLINRFATKVERIDILMDTEDEDSYFKSYFEPIKELTFYDFIRIGQFLGNKENIHSRKAKNFYDLTRSRDNIRAMYKKYLTM